MSVVLYILIINELDILTMEVDDSADWVYYSVSEGKYGHSMMVAK